MRFAIAFLLPLGLFGALTAVPKGPNQINLTWPPSPNPGYGYLVEIQSSSDTRYSSWTEWRPIPPAAGYTCDPKILINAAPCTISDPTGAHVYKPPTNGVPWWVTEPTYLDPQDGTPAQFIAHGLKSGTAYSFRMRTYSGNAAPTYGAWSNVASATTADYRIKYVSPTGSDSSEGNGRDDAHAWQTLGHASLLACGQALVLLPGTYASGFSLSQTCSAASKVVVMADPGALVTLTGPIAVDGHSLVLDGLTVRAALGGGDYTVVVGGSNNALFGIDLAPPASPGGYAGLQMRNGAFHLLYGSYIHDWGSPDATQNPGGNGGFPFDIMGTHGAIVWSNHITRGGHDTSLCKGGCIGNRWLNNIMDGGWGMGWEAIEQSTGNLLEGSVIFDPGQLVSFYKPGVEASSAGNTIRRNLILNAKSSAVEVSAIEGGDTVIGTRVYNNTIYRPAACIYESSNGGAAKYADLVYSNNICYRMSQAESGFGIMYSANPASQIANNSIVYADAQDVLQPDARLVRYYGASEYPTTLALAEKAPGYSPPFANNLALAVRPQFVDETAGDFHLAPASPLRGKGAAIVDAAWPVPGGTADVGIGSPQAPVVVPPVVTPPVVTPPAPPVTAPLSVPDAMSAVASTQAAVANAAARIAADQAAAVALSLSITQQQADQPALAEKAAAAIDAAIAALQAIKGAKVP